LLRTLAKTRRAEAFGRLGTAAGSALAEQGQAFFETLRSGGTRLAARAPTEIAVSGFSAINDEIDPGALMERLRAAGHPLTLPTMQGKGRPLVFRSWKPGDDMAPAVWGIAEPLSSRPQVFPDIVLVPLLAFDAAGHRLGYGGGFYDRSLDQLRRMKPVLAVGVAYDEQQVDAVPHLDYDQPLDWVLTPSGPLKCGLVS
jgi:5-formyltetrahydrofolate cyclo-ligase